LRSTFQIVVLQYYLRC